MNNRQNPESENPEIAYQSQLVKEMKQEISHFQDLKRQSCYAPTLRKLENIGLVALPFAPVLTNTVVCHQGLADLFSEQADIKNEFVHWLGSVIAAGIVTGMILVCAYAQSDMRLTAWKITLSAYCLALIFPVVAMSIIVHSTYKEEGDYLAAFVNSAHLIAFAFIALVGDFLTYMLGSQIWDAGAAIADRNRLRRMKRNLRREEERVRDFQRQHKRTEENAEAIKRGHAYNLKKDSPLPHSQSKNEAAPFTNGVFKEEIPDRDDETNPKV